MMCSWKAARILSRFACESVRTRMFSALNPSRVISVSCMAATSLRQPSRLKKDPRPLFGFDSTTFFSDSDGAVVALGSYALMPTKRARLVSARQSAEEPNAQMQSHRISLKTIQRRDRIFPPLMGQSFGSRTSSCPLLPYLTLLLLIDGKLSIQLPRNTLTTRTIRSFRSPRPISAVRKVRTGVHPTLNYSQRITPSGDCSCEIAIKEDLDDQVCSVIDVHHTRTTGFLAALFSRWLNVRVRVIFV